MKTKVIKNASPLQHAGRGKKGKSKYNELFTEIDNLEEGDALELENETTKKIAGVLNMFKKKNPGKFFESGSVGSSVVIRRKLPEEVKPKKKETAL